MLKEADGPVWLQNLGLPHFWVDIQGGAGGSLGELPIEAVSSIRNGKHSATTMTFNE
jgi:thiamine biosynthesis lipoprotein